MCSIIIYIYIYIYKFGSEVGAEPRGRRAREELISCVMFAFKGRKPRMTLIGAKAGRVI